MVSLTKKQVEHEAAEHDTEHTTVTCPIKPKVGDVQGQPASSVSR